MAKHILISTLVLSLILSCCSKAPESLASRETIDGIEHVRNTAEPRYPDKTLTLEEELAIGGEDQEGNVILFDAGYVLVDEDENIWIVDRRDFNIKVFDPEGNFVRSIGKQGEGPGEFQGVGYVTFLPDGRLLVMDYQASRTSLFDKAGGFISISDIPIVTTSGGKRIRLSGDRFSGKPLLNIMAPHPILTIRYYVLRL